MKIVSCVLLCVLAVVEAAINPNPKFRVKILYGIEEPASVLFSFITLISVLSLVPRLIRASKAASNPEEVKRTYPFNIIWITLGSLAVASSLCSVLFHSYETRPREVGDYFVAIMSIFSLASTGIIRLFDVQNPLLQTIIFGAGIGSLIPHFHFMLYVKFDYGKHFLICGIAAVLGGILWLLWSGWNLFANKKKHCVFCLLSLFSLMTLCVAGTFDFVPLWKFIDAHSIWHLGLLFFSYAFLLFCEKDMLAWFEDNSLGLKKGI